MSYILDALKKSGQERQQETPPHLQPLHYTPPSFKAVSATRRRRWPWLLCAGLLMISGGLLTWSAWKSPDPAGQLPPLVPPMVSENGKPLGPVTVHPEKFDDWYQHLPKKALPPSGPESPQPVRVERKAAAPAISPAAAKPTAAGGKKNPEPVKTKKAREKNSQPPPEATTVIESPPPVAVEQPKSIVPYLQDLPPHVQEELPKLQFAGHAFAVDPAKRMIIINGKIMKEGDRIDALTRLSEITWEGVIIDSKGLRFRVKCY
jgi:general secretion pathway protein B